MMTHIIYFGGRRVVCCRWCDWPVPPDHEFECAACQSGRDVVFAVYAGIEWRRDVLARMHDDKAAERFARHLASEEASTHESIRVEWCDSSGHRLSVFQLPAPLLP